MLWQQSAWKAGSNTQSRSWSSDHQAAGHSCRYLSLSKHCPIQVYSLFINPSVDIAPPVCTVYHQGCSQLLPKAYTSITQCEKNVIFRPASQVSSGWFQLVETKQGFTRKKIDFAETTLHCYTATKSLWGCLDVYKMCKFVTGDSCFCNTGLFVPWPPSFPYL